MIQCRSGKAEEQSHWVSPSSCGSLQSRLSRSWAKGRQLESAHRRQSEEAVSHDRRINLLSFNTGALSMHSEAGRGNLTRESQG